VYPVNRVSILPEVLSDLKVPPSSTVVISCISTILVEAGTSEPAQSRMPEVFEVLKEYSDLIIRFSEEVESAKVQASKVYTNFSSDYALI
jgi:hypothetical protein